MLMTVRALMGALLLVFSPAVASAQITPEQARIFAAWSLEVSNFTLETMAVMEDVDTVFVILEDYNTQAIDQAEANARMAALRAEVESTLDQYQARSEVLLANTPGVPSSQNAAVNAMASLPVTALGSARDFADTTLTFAEQFLAGENPDGIVVDMARTNVLKNHYLSLVTVNTATRDTVASDQPQHHLLNAFALSSQNIAHAFDFSRVGLGATLEGATLESLQGEIVRNNEEILRSIELGRNAQSQMLTLLSSRSPQQLGLSAEQHTLITGLMETYTQSFDVEAALVDLFAQTYDIAVPAIQSDEWASWDAWLNDVSALEDARNDSQLARQQMVAQ